MAVLDLCCCVQTFSSRDEQGLVFIAVVSPVAERRL